MCTLSSLFLGCMVHTMRAQVTNASILEFVRAQFLPLSRSSFFTRQASFPPFHINSTTKRFNRTHCRKLYWTSKSKQWICTLWIWAVTVTPCTLLVDLHEGTHFLHPFDIKAIQICSTRENNSYQIQFFHWRKCLKIIYRLYHMTG